MTQIKDTAIYYRTSSKQQVEDIERRAALAFIKSHGIEDPLVFNDRAVSAMSIKMDERKQLMELLELIKTGQIKKLIVFDRARLARDHYEFIKIADILYEHNVQVFFTAPNHIPFQDQKFLEIFALD